MPERNADSFACDLLVFDLDGTLIDSEQDLEASVNATLDHLGRHPLEAAQIAGFIGDGAAMLVRRALDATAAQSAGGAGSTSEDLMKPALSFFLEYYRHHNLDHTVVYPGVLEALAAIRALAPDLPMAVLTNKPVRPSRVICDGLGLSPFFFQIYGGDSFPTKKPEPSGLLTLVREAGESRGRAVSLRRTVLLGDSHVDAETARNAGVLCLGCLHGLAPERLKAAGADAFAVNADGWLPALRTLLG